MTRLRCMLIVLFALPLWLFAQEGASTGSVQVVKAEAPSTRPFKVPGFENRPAFNEVPTTQQWDVVRSFLADNLPATLRAYEQLNDDDRREEAQKQLFGRFRELQQLKDPELYQLKLDQAKLADALLPLLGQLGRAYRARDDGEVNQIKEQMKQIMTQRLKLELKERERRISKLQAQLQAEQAKLDMDNQMLPSNVETKVNALAATRMRARFIRPGDGPFFGGPRGGFRPPSVPATTQAAQ